MQTERQAVLRKAADYWDNASQSVARLRWWQSPAVIRHVNRKIDPESGERDGCAFHRRLARMEGAPFKKALSVGCGEGRKEMSLVKEGTAESFELFEISRARVEKGRELAQEEGLADRVRFYLVDALPTRKSEEYDLVYWNNSLHHMLDAREAVRWSRNRLRPGGLFAMYDYVGASRFQWSDLALQVISDFRSALPERFLWLPRLGKAANVKVERPAVGYMLSMDPTEAADSANILPAVNEFFQNAEIILTGGHIYFTGLNNILQNFEEDGEYLRMALKIDDMLSKAGENLYAVAFARKTG